MTRPTRSFSARWQACSGPAPSEGDERRLPGIAAALRHVHAHRPRHGLVDDVVHGPRRLEHRLSARPGEMFRDAVARRGFVEAHRTAGEVVGVEVSEQQVGIGHRRPGAAAAVADRPGVGACALRPDLHEAHGVDPGDAAPAGPDLDHVDRRHRHRKAARAREPPGPRHLELVGDRHRPVADEARLRRRSAHVERQDLRQRERLRDLAPDDGAGHRPRLDEPQREVGRGLGGPEAAVGQHHPQRRGVSGAGEAGVEVAEVVPDERLHVGVDHRGAGALVLLDLRQHLGGGGHRDLGGELVQKPRRLLLVLGVDVRVQEGDRDRAHPLRPHERDGGLDLLRRDRTKDGAVAVGALVDGDPQMPRDQRSRWIGPELVGRDPDVAAKLEYVTKAAGREQRRARALALDDRVGDQGGGVRDAARAGDVRGVDGAEWPQAFENGDRGVGRSRQTLLDVNGAGALVVQDEIGERAPDVAAQPIRRPRLAHRSLPGAARLSRRAGWRRCRFAAASSTCSNPRSQTAPLSTFSPCIRARNASVASSSTACAARSSNPP